jgi:hypothetical protein
MYGKASPYLPVIELLKSYVRIEPHDDDRTRRQKVIGKVLELDRSLEDILPYLFTLLGIDDQQATLAQMDAQIRRRRTLEALKKVFLRESLNHLFGPVDARAVEGKAQERACSGWSHRTLALIDLQLQVMPEAPSQAGFDARARSLAVDDDEEVVPVAGEAVAASFQFLIQVV